jgi:hypothetical protein
MRRSLTPKPRVITPPFVAIEGYGRDSSFTEHRFDKADFVSDDKGTKTTVAGHLIRVTYSIRDKTYGGWPYLLNSLQEELEEIQRQIEGVQILNQQTDGQCHDPLFTVRFQKGNTPVWVAVSCQDEQYAVTVVEEQAFHH